MKFHCQDIIYVKSIVLKVKDISKMKNFYQEILGFSILKEQKEKVVLGTTRELLTLETEDGVSIKNGEAGLYHVAFLLPSRSDLAALSQHLFQKDIELGAGDHFVSEAIYFNDPEGNGIEMYVDRDAETWQWHGDEVLMGTDPVDFEDLFQEIKGPYIKLPEETIIGHLHLQVSNLDINRNFYEEGLGLKIVSQMPRAVFMSDGKYHHHLALNTWNGTNILKPTANSTGLKTMYVNVPSIELKETIKENLLSLGFEIHDGFVIDPSGIQVVFEVQSIERG